MCKTFFKNRFNLAISYIVKRVKLNSFFNIFQFTEIVVPIHSTVHSARIQNRHHLLAFGEGAHCIKVLKKKETLLRIYTKRRIT